MFKTKKKLSPIVSFIILIFATILISGFLHLLNIQSEYTSVNKVTGELVNNVVEVKSLFSTSGIKHIVTTAVSGFVNFEPLGALIIVLIGIGILEKTGFFSAMGWSFFITILSVAVIIFFTSMTAYYITRVKSKATNVLYYLFVFSMIVPFQMVMFPMVKLADTLNLSNPLGMVALYLGFGSGLSVFMFSGFIKSIPLEIEEAAMIDGCNPLQTYFHIVLPILKPTSITVAILNAMWVWNDYLLPYLVIGLSTKYKTIPVVIQMLVGSNGNRDMGAMMAMLVLAIIPIVVFYLACQKHIIEGVVAGAVKG